MIKKMIENIFAVIGLKVIKKSTYNQIVSDGRGKIKIDLPGSMIEGLNRAKNRNIEPKTIIDIGAAKGNWSLKAKEIWEEADFLLIEPLEERKEVLVELKKQNPNFYIVNKALGNKEDILDFFVTEDLDGSGVADNGTDARKVKVEMTTLDNELQKLNLKPPFLLKFDTHGFEVPILEGAENTLVYANLIIIECYGYQIAPNSLLFWEMCEYMQSKGFRLVDIVDVMHRPKDKTFWQCDVFFERIDKPYFNYNTYHY